jgi:hypothetical protein
MPTLQEEVSSGDRHGTPGAVRISFGFYKSRQDMDAVVSALCNIHNGEWKGEYRQKPRSGEYKPLHTKTDPAG